MPKEEKFNPIAKLPILPGTEAASDDDVTNVIDSTYPPIPAEKISEIEKELKKPKIEIRVKPSEPAKVIVKEEEKDQLFSVRVIILVCLVALVIFGIFLTLTIVPKIFKNVTNFSQSFGSLFMSNKVATTTNVTPAVTATIPIVSTPTPSPTAPTYNQPTPTPTNNAPVNSAPAKIVSNLISTQAIGNRIIARFNVQNIGGTTSGTWSFTATLPSSITPTYHSVAQNPLAPKSGVIYTLTFTATEDLPIQISILQ